MGRGFYGAGRGSGDEVSNPGALLVLAGTPITDVALYKDRLWIVGGPFACSSQIKEHWQFFNDNYKLAKDLDPVNRTISGTKALADGETENPAAIAFGFQGKH